MKNIISPAASNLLLSFGEIATGSQKRFKSENKQGSNTSLTRKGSHTRQNLAQPMSRPSDYEHKYCSNRNPTVMPKKEPDVSFSHRSVAMNDKEEPKGRIPCPGNHTSIAKVIDARRKQMQEIRTLRLRPDISRDILLKTRLDKFLPKRNLQPTIYPHKNALPFDKNKHERLLTRFLETMQRSADLEKVKEMEGRNRDILAAARYRALAQQTKHRFELQNPKPSRTNIDPK